ncbi:hypothetical protein BT96DRAFT_1006114 [Gymnopus androsaceus JB14]|uniref:MULE transposase domain-containing protein n=1 Tax=Gymnopus androsaceus JB14 TaxID=1447944 RepID=A0A6A4GLI8_9AGAR|nr:hypothetical protein BT96DRAFT_1006114 [Gymnopus androsaceus JB14]
MTDPEILHLKLAASEYSTPLPHAAFSDDFFCQVTFLQAGELSLPVIAAKGMLSHWTFDHDLPSTTAATVILPNEIVPHMSNLQAITSSMEKAYIDGYQLVNLSLNIDGGCITGTYHFSKICLYILINNNYPAVDAGRRLAEALEKSSLSADLISRFMREKLWTQIQGFSATCALWNLVSLLDEEWLYDNILNCLSELLYFQRATAADESKPPPFMFLPTCFIESARFLYSYSGQPPEYSPELHAFRQNLKATGPNFTFSFISKDNNYYLAYDFKEYELCFEFGDSKFGNPPDDIQTTVNWILKGISMPCEIQRGFISTQPGVGRGSGSCGVAAFNFIERKRNLLLPSWTPTSSSNLQMKMLLDLVIYHFIATDTPGTFDDWVIPCVTLTTTSLVWLLQLQLVPAYKTASGVFVSSGSSALLGPPIVLKTLPPDGRNDLCVRRSPAPASLPITISSTTSTPCVKCKLDDIPTSTPKCPKRIHLTQSPSISLLTPSTVMCIKAEHPPSLIVQMVKDERSPSSFKREECSPSITCISPPTVKVKMSNIILLPPQPHVDVKQERAGQKMLGGHGHNSVAVYGEYKPHHEKDIDPADFCIGRNVKTECMAHVNLCHDGSLWCISLVDLVHNHDRYLPISGTASRPPTEEQWKLISELAISNMKFSCAHISSILSTQSIGHPLEPRQIGNILNSSRKEAHDEVKHLGGDIGAIIWSLEEKNRTDPGWRYHVKPAKHFGDVIINDNSYNKVDCQYPLNTGVIVNGHNCSQNIWYCFHCSEDVETFTWVLRCYLGDESLGDAIDLPEVFISDCHASLIASVADTLPTSFHVYCLYHLEGNIHDNLWLPLGAKWTNFTCDFWAAYRAISPEEFDRLWKHLIACYPSLKVYLEEQLYPC